MKEKRHLKILELIEINIVDTQEALQQLLNKFGYKVTQATVSRDIKELQLIKTIAETGSYKYALPPTKQEKNPLNSLSSIVSEAVVSIDYAINTVVIKCHIGMAQAVCAKLDYANFSNVVGTLAGDDTIFILMRSENNAIELVNVLNDMI